LRGFGEDGADRTSLTNTNDTFLPKEFRLCRRPLLEVVWPFFMKKSEGFTLLVPSAITIVTMIASFGLRSYAMRTLPLGTAYTVWTGIGAMGAFIVGIVWLGESSSAMRIVAALLIISGIVLMKLSSPPDMAGAITFATQGHALQGWHWPMASSPAADCGTHRFALVALPLMGDEGALRSWRR
jgi:quaternary ammonium compound-resistance protein SugE